MAERRIILSGNLIINDTNELLLLYRKDHQHYETPGGKVEAYECVDYARPTIPELEETARRELKEELGNAVVIQSMAYFDHVAFVIPDGRLAIAHKFLVRIAGTPIIAEPDVFEKYSYITLGDLEKEKISPDLKLLLPKLKEKLL